MLWYAFSKVISFLTGGYLIFYKNSTNEEGSNIEELSTEENEDVEQEEDVSKSNKLCLNGVVTSYFNNRGLINEEIFFNRDIVQGDEEPQVGDTVTVEAHRLHQNGGWVADGVQIVHFWDVAEEEKSANEKDTLVGEVVSVIANKSLTILVSCQFSVGFDKLSNGYYPRKGDWIQVLSVQSEETNLREENVICVSPLRLKSIAGAVTDLFDSYGFINGNIFFHFPAYKRREYKLGLSVEADVIETKVNKRGEWRAILVFIRKQNKQLNDEVKKVTQQRPKVTNEISMNEDGDFVKITVKEKRTVAIKLSNNTERVQRLVSIVLPQNTEGLFCSFLNVLYHSGEEVNFEKPISFATDTIHTFTIEFTPRYLGRFDVEAVFRFEQFDVDYRRTASVHDTLQRGINTGTVYEKKFFGKRLNTSASSSPVIPGQRPVRMKKVFLPNKLAKYPIPSNIKNCSTNVEDLTRQFPELLQPLHISNYRKKLSTLLHIEEMKKEEEMREFDLQMVLLRDCGEFFSLEVPGLSEGRPSLMLGDTILVTFHGKSNSPQYEGCIHQVRAEDVLLMFSEDFHKTYANDDVDVQFFTNRTPMRRAHQAIENALNMGEQVLFPTYVQSKQPLSDFSKDPLKLYNQRLNKRQRQAVERIVSAHARPMPYVLFGPPGTGKSVTLCEAILQVFTRIKHSRLLVCAPSNSAADLLAERLHESGVLTRHTMVRLNAFQRNQQSIAEEIKKYCVQDGDELQRALRTRVIITTCNMSGFIYSFDLKVGHFTHVFVDEAGQCTEPECMIPVGFLAGCEDAQVTLAGDPFQLGAVLRSNSADELGLSMSYLERLTLRKLYSRNEQQFTQSGCYNPLLVTKLLNNYRSHPSLLQLCSNIFYDRELIACADDTFTSEFVGASILPNKDIPFVFHGIRGEDFQEGNSPSWFNPGEAVQVTKYVQLIMNQYTLNEDDIGIITPYKKQVEKIRILLEQFGLPLIKIGSVEEFQGQERKCILISTVRSKEILVDSDVFHNIGFLSNPKRFNVALTRAQSLLVVVGNPAVLCYDVYWCAMLQYAVMNKCYTGCQLPSLQSHLVQENFKQAAILLGMKGTEQDEKETTEEFI